MKKSLSRRLLAVLALVAGFLVIPLAPAAHADAGCPGSWDIKRDWKNSAGTVAASTQYYETSDGGACISLVAKGAYYGREKTMSLTVCNGVNVNCQTDTGIYRYYAGPIFKAPVFAVPNCYRVHAKMGDGYGNVLFDKWEDFGVCE